MAGWIPPRLRSLLGADLDTVDAAALQRLIGVPEDTDLDFKSELHARTEGEVKEAAYDVAQFANSGGGLLILGVEEDGTGCAAAIKGVQPADRDYGLWVHQVSASRISPTPQVVYRVVNVGDRAVHLISVPPGISAPHAVAVGGDAYRVPVRSGNTRRWLHEAELADRYRRRFADLRQREALTDALQKTWWDRRDSLLLDNEPGDQKHWSWLVLTLVPDTPGELELREGVQQAWLAWLRPALRDFPSELEREIRHVRLGFRCFDLTDSDDAQQPVYALGGKLQLDGSGVIALAHPGGQAVVGTGPGTRFINDESLIADLINGLAILGEHALRTGAPGSATVSARLINPRSPMIVAQYRTVRKPPGPLSGSHSTIGLTGTSRHTLPIDALLSEGPERLLGPRLLVADLVSAFGLAEPQQITTNLDLVLNRFSHRVAPAVEQWADRHSIPLIRPPVVN